MSDRELSPARSDRSYSKERDGKSRSASPRDHRRSDSHKKRSRSRSKSPGRSKYRSRSRSRSYHRDRYHRDRYSRSRSHSPYYKRRSSRYEGGSRGYRRSRSPMSSRRRHYGDREQPSESRCLGVFGLSLYTQERDLKEFFGRYGPVDEVNVVYDHSTGKSRGFAFLYMKHLEDAVEAKNNAPGTELDGKKIRVDYSITERAHTPTPGIYLGKPTGRRGYRDDGYGRSGGGGRRRSPSPYYGSGGGGGRSSRRYYSRSRSRSYSPRRY